MDVAEYTVEQGDCILSISKQAGLLWSTVWNHPANQNLKQQRKDPNVLLPGDIVFVPEKEIKEETRATDQRHRFLLKQSAAQLKLRLVDRKQRPRPNLSYSLSVDGEVFTGTSDGQGFIKASVPPDAVKAVLTVHDPEKIETYELPLGHVDPVTEDSGVRHRLVNLGFLAKREAEVSAGEITKAVTDFQKLHGLPGSGNLDSATRDKLKEAHGS